MITRSICIALLLTAASLHAAIKTEPVEYKAGDTTLKGFLAYDDSTTEKRPGVIVVHEWWGNDEYPQSRAKQLAELGYVALAIDMYGDAKTTNDPKEAGAWSGKVHGDPTTEKARFEAGLDELKKQPNVDPTKIAAIGYCFGGGIVLDAARWNEPLVGVVSFHGSLGTEHPATDTIKPKVLVCTGAADSFVPEAAVQKFKDEFNAAHADVKVIEYPGAHHAFTNPKADEHHMDNIKYDPEADKQSWQAMKDFLNTLFGK